jgi:hypothetical protein
MGIGGSATRTLVLAVAVLAAESAFGQSPAFMNAVAFALTGSDAAPVQVIDRANCIFMINSKIEDGRAVGEIFHLNNVQTDRISIQPWQNVAGRWVEVSLRGASTIYEYTGAYQIDTTNSAMPRDTQEKLQGISRPRRSDSFTIKLYTTETDRVIRAWRSIYANGCKGSKSAF